MRLLCIPVTNSGCSVGGLRSSNCCPRAATESRFVFPTAAEPIRMILYTNSLFVGDAGGDSISLVPSCLLTLLLCWKRAREVQAERSKKLKSASELCCTLRWRSRVFRTSGDLSLRLAGSLKLGNRSFSSKITTTRIASRSSSSVAVLHYPVRINEAIAAIMRGDLKHSSLYGALRLLGIECYRFFLQQRIELQRCFVFRYLSKPMKGEHHTASGDRSISSRKKQKQSQQQP